ncbi:MAG TPA: ABC transporter ATP-binding protein [Verrucomicrobiae bacterium]|nr:ABC transporter ATP-binding protein [Verrucomicrobiae bacterium]
MEQDTIVVAEGLTKRYGNKTTVKGVSFAIKKGEIFGILGPNGAGKTTTLEMIETLRHIDEGQAFIDGIDVSKHPNEIKKIIGVQTQSTAFYERLNLREQLQLLASIYNVTIDIDKILASVNLTEKAKDYPEKLSGGQKQRFSIAAALINTPKVLFLDEPTTGLDPQARQNLWELIQDIKARGITIVMTTHYMEEAQLLCDRVAVMDNGEIIAMDSPAALIKQLLETGFKKPKEVLQADLEDVFINLTGKGLRD